MRLRRRRIQIAAARAGGLHSKTALKRAQNYPRNFFPDNFEVTLDQFSDSPQALQRVTLKTIRKVHLKLFNLSLSLYV
jgi:hypothetical protein